LSVSPSNQSLPASGTTLAVRSDTALSTNVIAPPTVAIDETLHLRDLLRILLKRKWWILSTALLVTLLAGFQTLLQTPLYRATVTMQIERNAAKVVDYKDGTNRDDFSYDEREFLNTQFELLRSKVLAERVMESMQLDIDVASKKSRNPAVNSPLSDASTETRDDLWGRITATLRKRNEPSVRDLKTLDREALIGSLRSAITVEPVRSSRLVRLHAVNQDPVLAARIANVWAESHITANLERRFEASSYAKKFLEEQLAKTKVRLEDSERQLNEYTRSKKIVNVDDKTNFVSQNLSEFSSALAKAEQERIKAEANYEEVKRNPLLGKESSDARGSTTAFLREQKLKLETEYQEQLKVYRPGFPKMQQLRAQIDELDKQLATETQRTREGALNASKAALDSAKQQEDQLRARADSAKRTILEQQDQGIRFNILKREVDTNRELYAGLLQRFKEVGVAGGLGNNNISVVDKAETPFFPFKPDLQRGLLIGLLLGLMTGLGLAFLLEYLDDSIKFPDEVERFLGLSLLGAIPKVNVRVTSAFAQSVQDPRSHLAEAYRSVRTSLQFSTASGAPRTILITSCSKGEGKSTTSLSLAVTLAQMGKRVLVVDGDMRNPTLHKLLSTQSSPGLSNLLSSDVDPVTLTQSTPFEGLYLMASGPMPPNPVELLSGKRLAKLLAPSESNFDHIVIDGPPVLGIADSIVLANQAEATVFVVQAGGARKASIRGALKRLQQAGVRPLGAVLTKIDHGGAFSGYDTDYYYYGASDSPKTAN
jgi:polysaccharide biosynthesis transport protein